MKNRSVTHEVSVIAAPLIPDDHAAGSVGATHKGDVEHLRKQQHQVAQEDQFRGPEVKNLL